MLHNRSISAFCLAHVSQQNVNINQNSTPSLHFCPVSSFLRSPEGIDSQPPALPPKQLSRKTLSQIIQAHSQQSLLDNHLNEMYDVPVNTDKTTVSRATRKQHNLKKINLVVLFLPSKKKILKAHCDRFSRKSILKTIPAFFIAVMSG